MSSVSPADNNGSVYYTQGLRDLQDQLDSETRKNRVAREKTAEELETHYKTLLAHKDQETENLVSNIREDHASRIALEKQKNSDARNQDNAIHQRSLEQEKQNTNDAVQNTKASYQIDVDRLKNQLYNAKGQLANTSQFTEPYERKVAEAQSAALQQQEHERDNLKNLQNNYQNRLNHQEQENETRIQNLTRQQTEHLREAASAADTFKNDNRDQNKISAEATQKNMDENNRFLKIRENQIHDAFDETKRRLKEDLNTKDSYYMDRTKNILDREGLLNATIIRNQNTDHLKEQNALEDQVQKQMDQAQQLVHQNNQNNIKNLQNQSAQFAETEANALTQQAKNYEKTYHRTNTSHQDQIDTLQKALNHQKTSQNTVDIPPAAENALYQQLVTEHMKLLSAETEKNKLSTDRLQSDYNELYRQTADEASDEKTKILQNNAREKTLDRNQYLTSLEEVNLTNTEKIRRQDSLHEREMTHTMNKFNRLLEGQRHEYEQIFRSYQLETENRVSTIQQEHEMNTKLLNHSFNVRQNEMVHDYEKKLEDQKAEYEITLEELNAKSKNDLRSTENRMQQDAEAQLKAYNQYTAHLEGQHQEREKNLARNYQDQLDRMRHSYELSNKAKG